MDFLSHFYSLLLFYCQLTSSDDSLYANIGSIDLFGKVPNGLVGVFVGVRMDVGPAAWKLDWMHEKVKKQRHTKSAKDEC